MHICFKLNSSKSVSTTPTSPPFSCHRRRFASSNSAPSLQELLQKNFFVSEEGSFEPNEPPGSAPKHDQAALSSDKNANCSYLVILGVLCRWSSKVHIIVKLCRVGPSVQHGQIIVVAAIKYRNSNDAANTTVNCYRLLLDLRVLFFLVAQLGKLPCCPV